jgi:ABC-type uncharacterized transport system involved in gliding motility auxiliary subunit
VDRRLTFVGGLLILLVLFFAVNILASAILRSARVDLTEQNLYTLSAGSRNIAASIGEPIRLRLYYSRSLATARPALKNYGQRVRELLEEYARASGGSIVLEVIDPEPFSEAEDEAVQAGLAGIPVASGQNFYFGLVGTNAVDDREIVRFFDPSQEQFLEYRVSRLIYTLSSPDRPTVGVLSGLPLEGTPPSPMGGQGDPPWQIMTELRNLFEVEMIEAEATALPTGIDVLLLIHPKGLNDVLLYAIDQFVLGGGHAVVFVDPNCESELPPPMARQDPMAAFQLDRTSNLPTLFATWGIEFDPSMIVGDSTNAQQVFVPVEGRREQVSYVAWLALDDDAVDPDDPVTGRLASLNLATAGELKPREGASTDFLPIVQSSSDSMMIDALRLRFGPNPAALLVDFEPSGERRALAARISGSVSTAFPEGRPGQAEPAEPGADDAGAGSSHLSSSDGPVNLIVVADVDMLADRFWVQEETLFGQIRLGMRKISDNGDLLVNALDNLAGSTDLISVRARGQYARPFELVEEIQRRSEREYRAEEQRLQQTLEETEQRLNELQQARPDQGQLILTPEQQQELDRFNEQRVETRKQLRAVRLDLRRDIENLGTWLKVVNVAAAPLLVALLAICLGAYRSVRRRSDRRAVAHT